MLANVNIFQDLNGFGYKIGVSVWIPRRDVSLSELKKDAQREAKRFLEEAVKALD